MEPLQIGILLGVLAFFAHIVKGLTGFGPAIVFVSIGSMIYDPTKVIVLASLLDIIGGSYLSILNPEFFENKKYWAPIGLLMVTGAVIGGVALSVIPPGLFEYLLGGAIILISFWFLLGKFKPEEGSEGTEKLQVLDGAVGAFAGFCGGFTGMGGPPLVVYLGSKFRKELFRAVVVPIFLLAAIARFSTYGYLGMIDTSNIYLYILPPTGVILGNYLGNQLFQEVEQKKFTILIGLILMISGLRLILG
ncbi:sulfite exporter TauE/SafE family protein [Candidatus Nanosalina sp. VS9-1]|uniref:sulfite exporter TauE/SafE family protein n=1 Tax=Candidatus Nanosalina sp. VS9-1 TaxID=3388566 RepID=UPI0039E039E0